MVGPHSLHHVGIRCYQFQVKFAEEQRRDQGHFIVGKIHARAFVRAAAKTKQQETILFVLFAAWGITQRVELFRAFKIGGQFVADALCHLHQPTGGDDVIAKLHLFLDGAHEHVGRRP